MKLFLKTALLILVSGSISAQNFYKERISRDNILTIGVGPSFAYLDNGGQYRSLNFEIRPSFSLGLTKRLNQTFDLRSTAGFQQINSGGNPPTVLRDQWFQDFASFTAKGTVYFFDLVPSVNLIRFSNHMNRSLFNLYGGFGLGIMNARTKQTKSFSSEEEPTTHQVSTGYVPVRAGLSLRVGPYSDIAGEGTMLWTFSDNLDGNVGNNRYGDHLFQAQIVYRRYFVPKTRD
ncbi:hypothetical protein [Algoriphagus boritolerans]|uniref:Outer membrane protein beta-barrel domain-containing protein n=3 Tax=Algoriphagus TaxID=246875 RepID=A0A1H5WAV3_9BACT|nr:hypothetical protein [Algoriphagus boritolerans]SEF96488.1 hypothetical protein SAMN03080598_02001 [Algoriphagus boritolerans DSM 17298 = JCM 18970]